MNKCSPYQKLSLTDKVREARSKISEYYPHLGVVVWRLAPLELLSLYDDLFNGRSPLELGNRPRIHVEVDCE